ncbi:UvrD-helicase domain-containing protein [Halobacteria archaeon AArc-m2/3/4]|uniref:DNA 3'-5' helicase n=1 Tax=Natronoglomus mannanivorans TaxID=2979990 RepID=A0ABT2QIH6_9EURY|nr:UvrD-helicase domain-containing protein [Halobacteria archaeon AArc-m2/3/4]
MPERHSFPAFEELKQETQGVDVLVELAPPPFEAAVDWLFDVEYLERKAELLERRDAARRRYQEGQRRIESTYGTVVVRALDRRADGDQPRFDVDRMATELADAKAAVDGLVADLDEAFLTRAERRKLSELESDIVAAREYVRNKRAFDEGYDALAGDLEAFEERFEPYAGAERYMVTSDREFLVGASRDIWADLSDLARELQLHVLPDEDARWLSEHKTRFGELVDAIPAYNEEFVANERDRYADLLEDRPEHGPLNDQQQNAVVRDDRRNLVDASAGTGKTLTLTYRFQYLLEKGVPAGDIAAITYTKDAAEEMAGRIAAATGVDEDDLDISTIHSFALSIVDDATVGSGSGDEETDLGDALDSLVDDYLEAAMADEKPDEADVPYPDVYGDFLAAFREFRRVDAEEEYVDTHAGWNQSRTDFLRSKLTTFVDNARTFDLEPADVRRKIDETAPIQFTFATAGVALLEAYLRRVEATEHPIDFDEMIYAATELIESAPDRFASRYSHVLVDEFQDVSDATLSFVEAFMSGDTETHLFCVGDDWQSIYGFNGSNVRYFTEYGERFEDVTYTPLEVNYRCPPSIVRAGAALMARSEAPQNDKPVTACSDLETDPTLHELDGLYEAREPGYVVDLVEDALASGYDLEDVMVLSRNDRNSTVLQQVREELARREIPHQRPDSVPDYVPESTHETFDREVVFDDSGDAAFESGPDEMGPDAPPMVTVQSVHASKGTEAPVVILAHAVDDDPEGIPVEERTDELVDPAIDISANHFAEERRLFYVALTRSEAEFHAVTKAGRTSRYVEDVRDYFEVVEPEFTLEGKCTEFTPPADDSNRPFKATLDCVDFEAPLMAWPNNDPPRLEEGAVYRITDPVVEEGPFGEEIRYDRSTVELLTSYVSTSSGDSDDPNPRARADDPGDD